MPNTYKELRRTVVGTATGTVTLDLTGISGYTDLVLVADAKLSVSGQGINLTFNGDTASNYSSTRLYGNGSTATSDRQTNGTFLNFALGSVDNGQLMIANIMNYSNATTFKTVLIRQNTASAFVGALVGLWRATPAAITSITLTAGGAATISVGSTFSLYGIANADLGAAKATGGIITEDSQYWYHTFGATGAFIPKQALTCDILVVAGGGGGTIGGGGAGGLLQFSSQSVTATTYNITVGAGGTAQTNNVSSASQGIASTFAGLTSAVGGGSGGLNDNNTSPTSLMNGGSGGGGGGSNSITTPSGTSTSGQGNAGASNGGITGGGIPGGGGGGAGAAGSTPVNNSSGGNGGIGATSAFINAIGAATGRGQTVSGVTYFAGGGGGGGNGVTNFGQGGFGGGSNASNVPVANASANTGGGGGGYNGGVNKGGNGGSGVVIVRYAK